jgi:hypothetical protein
MYRSLFIVSMGIFAFTMNVGTAQADVPPDLKAKVEAHTKKLSPLSNDATVIEAVRAYNSNPPAAAKDMTQEKWKDLTILSPEIKTFTKNALATYLRGKKEDVVSELFVSGADGGKVAFLAKTSSWSHKGKPKHDVPMKGKVWTGSVEVDESTGKQQIQIGLPVLDKGKAIGSIVIALDVMKL